MTAHQETLVPNYPLRPNHSTADSVISPPKALRTREGDRIPTTAQSLTGFNTLLQGETVFLTSFTVDMSVFIFFGGWVGSENAQPET